DLDLDVAPPHHRRAFNDRRAGALDDGEIAAELLRIDYGVEHLADGLCDAAGDFESECHVHSSFPCLALSAGTICYIFITCQPKPPTTMFSRLWRIRAGATSSTG